jgi:hypothetical protein
MAGKEKQGQARLTARLFQKNCSHDILPPGAGIKILPIMGRMIQTESGRAYGL